MCSRCGRLQPFRCSEKIRLNASGKRLDAWLIYKCVSCGQTWNRTLFERRAIRSLPPHELAALHSNDKGWVSAQAFDMDSLRRSTHRIDHSDEIAVRKHVTGDCHPGWTEADILLHVPLATNIRLDRLLARELHLSRSRLRMLHRTKQVRTVPDGKDIMRRSIQDGAQVILLRMPDLVPVPPA